jgi:hypothetical protein
MFSKKNSRREGTIMKGIAAIASGLIIALWVPIGLCADKSLEMIAPPYDQVLQDSPKDISSERHGVATPLDHLEQEYRMTLERNKLILFGLLSGTTIISLITVLLFIRNAHGANSAPSTEEMLSVSGLILIIFATVFLVLGADTQEQLSPPFGLLGAIAGYIFGRKTSTGARWVLRQEEEK